jgi:signal transduction histidine kinase
MGVAVNGDRTLSALTEELRTSVTPVLGYLELLAEDDPEALSEEQLGWIGTVEMRLASLQLLSDELSAVCARLRELSAA